MDELNRLLKIFESSARIWQHAEAAMVSELYKGRCQGRIDAFNYAAEEVRLFIAVAKIAAREGVES